MSKFNEEDDALLAELGVEVEVKKTGVYTKEEERIIAGFEEIQRFVEENGSAPQHGEDKDIFERLYAVRLDRLNELEECHQLLQPMDHQGLLKPSKKDEGESLEETMDDDELLEALGVEVEEGSLQELKHVRPSVEIRAADEVARRKKCEDFEEYKHLFEQVKSDLREGLRKTKKISGATSFEAGTFYIVNGQTAYLAGFGEEFKNVYKRQSERDNDARTDRRLKLIFDNGTESNQLLLSFKRVINADPSARIVTSLESEPLFSNEVQEGDVATGTLYVLRSLSKNPEIKKNRTLIHKIGFTTGKVERRIADAENQATYLLAKVEVVATYELFNVNANKLEGLIHRIFGSARLELELKDRFGKPFKPREWFLVPLNVIEEVVSRIQDGTIMEYQYDPKKAKLVQL